MYERVRWMVDLVLIGSGVAVVLSLGFQEW